MLKTCKYFINVKPSLLQDAIEIIKGGELAHNAKLWQNYVQAKLNSRWRTVPCEGTSGKGIIKWKWENLKFAIMILYEWIQFDVLMFAEEIFIERRKYFISNKINLNIRA